MSFKDREFRICLLYRFLLLFLIQFKYCEANVIYNITSLQPLSQEKTIVSPSQKFELGFFSPNNSVNQYVGIWYRGISPQTLVWVANRNNPTSVTDSVASLRISRNGNLQLVNGANNSIWSTNITAQLSTAIAVLEDNGNFVIRDISSEQAQWESFGDLGDTFLPGSVLSSNDRTGERKVLTSWKDFDDPSLGSFSFGISSQTPSQAFVWTNGSVPYWRSGPWDKSKFVGVPDMDTSYQSPLSIQEDLDKVTTNLVFESRDINVLAKMSISPKGVMKLTLRGKEEDSKDWETVWEGPKSRCDIYGVCGPFGICKDEKTENCECLKGFVPNSSEEWNIGIWTSGCRRRTELFCKNATNLASKEGDSDGFQNIRSIKIPDFYQFVIVGSVDQCRGQCANNCSCIAYTYINGIGCLVWFDKLIDIREFSLGGEELFLRIAHKEIAVGTKNSKAIVISVAVVSCCILIAATVLAMHFWRAKKKVKQLKGKRKQSTRNLDLITRKHTSTKQNDLLETQTFDLDTILVATNNFSEENKLGQGGFGPVYKGKLVDGKELAVKRLSAGSKQGVDEFKNETNLILKLQHRNLVRLIGCCTENEEKMLIYEFMPNKSLDFFIFDESKSRELNWGTRFNIILGVARGLLYLHRDSYLRIIHRDLKASNILLDEKMNPKISDFGLSRIFEGTSDIANTLKVVGTIGYMSPEYALAGDFSEKSDVFSLGVLILEIVSGKKNTRFNDLDNKHQSLISYAWQFWSENRGLDLVDKAFAESYISQEVTRCVNIGLLCVQDHADDRPTMPDVVFMLSNETNRPQPKRPTFTIRRPQRSEFRSPNDENEFSVNKVTISHLIEGR